MEANKKKTEEESEPEFGPPQFIQQLSIFGNLIEGQPAHFEAQIQPISDPNLIIKWYHNGRLLPASNRVSYRNDFGLITLDIHYVLPQVFF